MENSNFDIKTKGSSEDLLVFTKESEAFLPHRLY